MSERLSRGLTARVIYRSKRQKSGSMEEEVDSPGEYYHSPSPASSSRNWTEDMEGGNRTWICPAFTAVLCRDPAFKEKKQQKIAPFHLIFGTERFKDFKLAKVQLVSSL